MHKTFYFCLDILNNKKNKNRNIDIININKLYKNEMRQ